VTKDSKEAKFEFGEPCPPIKSWVFPKDPNKKPYPLGEEKENDSSQSS
jgi:hypothetical protein